MQVGAEGAGKLNKYSNNFSALIVLQLLYFVVDFNNLNGFNKESFSGSRFVVNKTLQLTLIACTYGYYDSSVAD